MPTISTLTFALAALISMPFALLSLAGAVVLPLAPAPKIQFNRDIRPILSDKCFACHGPDRNKRQANLRLDQPPPVQGGDIIVPGQPTMSKLVQRVTSADPAQRMPPASFGKSLTAAQRDLLVRWVKEGGAYQPHWAYIAPTRPTPPSISGSASTLIRNPIDNFILARLGQRGFTLSPHADRRTLCRRLYLDLIGIPPSPDELESFLNDGSPKAYDKLVEKLLASPHFGERMAIGWLDLVRYADTVGFHGDQNQNAWAYRDYVIDSFNKNKPFDRFTREQLAGDLLPDANSETRTATCFNRLNMVTREGGAQPKEYLAKYAADRVRTVSMTWLGSTMGCCECHDHKYDPFTQKDFYSLAAFFSDMKQWGVYEDYSYTPEPELRGLDNDSPFPPEIMVESPYLKHRIAHEKEQITEIARMTAPLLHADTPARASFLSWCKAVAAFLAHHADGWEIPAKTTASATVGKPDKNGPAPTFRPELQPDGSIRIPGDAPTTVTIELPSSAPSIAAIRVELLPSAERAGSILRGLTAGRTLTLSAKIHEPDSPDSKRSPVAFRYAGANLWAPHYQNGFDQIGVKDGWRLGDGHDKSTHVAVWRLNTPEALKPGSVVEVTLPNIPAATIRVSVSPIVPEDLDSTVMPTGLKAAMEEPESAAHSVLASRAYLLGSGWNPDALKQVRTLEAEIVSCRRGVTPVMVTESVTPRISRVLPRGNWQDESGAPLDPAVPHFLPQPESSPVATIGAVGPITVGVEGGPPYRRLTRLDLADWIVSPRNPLTARVFVNRLWKQYFGNGLSGMVEDLGAQGEAPTHPELLDWLACEFVKPSVSGGSTESVSPRAWDIKHMIRLMVTSATYRQSSKLRRDARDSDPANRLLSSQNPRRLEAELVRDNALRIAGLLNDDIGGPPVKPYQPGGYYANLQFPDRDYVADRDDREWRRGVYMHWQRTFLHPMLANFDAPSREDCIAARNLANTPQQALTLLNDPEFVEAARALAVRVMAGGGTDEARIETVYKTALCRPMKPAESKSILTFLHTMREEYAKRPDDAKKLEAVGYTPAPKATDPVELAAWTSVCRVVLNLHETITRY